MAVRNSMCFQFGVQLENLFKLDRRGRTADCLLYRTHVGRFDTTCAGNRALAGDKSQVKRDCRNYKTQNASVGVSLRYFGGKFRETVQAGHECEPLEHSNGSVSPLSLFLLYLARLQSKWKSARKEKKKRAISLGFCTALLLSGGHSLTLNRLYRP